MAKHRADWNWRRYHRLLDEGRGQGTGARYQPWLTIHDFASKGVVTRVWSQKTQRIHHFMSRNETAFFYILDHSDKVVDIREQYPLLPVTETVEIAEQLGIRHPRDTVSKYPYVMTSDFVITTPSGIVVRSVKMASELEKPRVLEKLEIERQYWAKRGIEWRIVTENEIDFQKASNIQWMYRSWDYSERLPEGLDAQQIKFRFQELYENTYRSIADIAREIEIEYELEAGMGLTTFQNLLLLKQINTVNLSKPLDLVSVRIPSEKGELASWIKTYA